MSRNVAKCRGAHLRGEVDKTDTLLKKKKTVHVKGCLHEISKLSSFFMSSDKKFVLCVNGPLMGVFTQSDSRCRTTRQKRWGRFYFLSCRTTQNSLVSDCVKVVFSAFPVFPLLEKTPKKGLFE
jgi:hypothetical protein